MSIENELLEFDYQGETPSIELLSYKGHELDDQLIINGSKNDVKIPHGVKIIGRECFAAKDIHEVILEEGVEEIKAYAFISALCLEKISLPSSLKVIEKGALSHTGLKEIKGLENTQIKRIEDKAFSYGKFKVIILPSSVEYIGKEAFESCLNLEYIYIPSSVKVIEEDAFKNCKNLKGIYLEGTILPTYKDTIEEKEVTERRISSGWDYHTHVGEPNFEEYTYIQKIPHSFKEAYHQVFENVSLDEFKKIIQK